MMHHNSTPAPCGRPRPWRICVLAATLLAAAALLAEVRAFVVCDGLSGCWTPTDAVLFASGTGHEKLLKLFRGEDKPMEAVVLITDDWKQAGSVVETAIIGGQLGDPGAKILFTVPGGVAVGLAARRDGGGRT